MMKSRFIFYGILACLLLCAIYFHNNAASIYESCGNSYYKKGNTTRAIECYEKAFSLGNQKVKTRENYVNLLINSPMTIDAQEKLVNIAEDDIKDAAQSNAEYFLYNLKREIHNKYPLNYIKQAPYNQKIVHWGNLPITYTFRNTGNAPDEIIKAIDSAFDEWELRSAHRIYFSKVHSSKADIIIEIRQNPENGNPQYGQKYVIANTTPSISNNKLKCMNIKFNLRDPDNNMFKPNQIYNTALHEIFHALGFMGHSFDKKNIMYMSTNKAAELNNKKLELQKADVSTLELLYKIKPDITNADNLEYEYVPYLVLGDSEEVNHSKIEEAKNYISKAPALPGGYIDLAESYVADKKYAEAIKCLEKALSLSNNNETKYIVYYNLAVSYFYIGNYELAGDNIERAKLIRDTEELHHISAENYLKQKDTNKAIEEYKYLVNTVPENIDYMINLVNIYVNEHNYIEARKILKTFIEKNPQEKNSERLSPYKVLLF